VLIGGVLALLGVGAAVAALVWLHLRPSGLSPVRDAVSQYGITRFRRGYRVLTLAMAVGGASAAVGLYAALHGRAAVVLAALGVFVVSRAVISWLPMDPPGTLVTPTGAWHILMALVAFVSLMVAAVRLGAVLERTGIWPSWHGAVVPFDVAFVAGLLAMVITRRLTGSAHVFGAVERAYYAVMLAWLAFVGVALIANG
jgi:hypothetical protein